MKIIVTGASGFIGSHLLKRLLDDNHQVHVIVRTSDDPQLLDKQVHSFVPTGQIDDLIAYLNQQHFDGVIHLASLFLAQHKSSDIKELIESNLLFSTTILEAATVSKIPWFINTGTFWQHFESKAYSPVNLYAATKQAFEDIAQYYVETGAINFVTIKLSDTFGPNDIRPKIFNLWARASQGNEPLDMSPGEQIIDINYIDNVIDAYARMIQLLSKDDNHQFSGHFYAVSSDQRMTLRELAKTFEQVTGHALQINWGKKPYRPREVMVPWDKGERIPGWKPQVSIEEGIKRTFK